jgi:hypothetical protein
MALVLNGVKYLVLHQAEEGIFITGCCNKSQTETGTQLVLTAATALLVSTYPCQLRREKHPAGRCTMC